MIRPQNCTILGHYNGDGIISFWQPKDMHDQEWRGEIGAVRSGHIDARAMIDAQIWGWRHSAIVLRFWFLVSLMFFWTLTYYVAPEVAHIDFYGRLARVGSEFRGFGALIYGCFTGIVNYIVFLALDWIWVEPLKHMVMIAVALAVFFVVLGQKLSKPAGIKKAD